GSRGRAARRNLGRDAMRVRDAEAGRVAHRRGDRRLVPTAHGALQGAEDRRLRGIAKDIDRQDPEAPPARARPRTVVNDPFDIAGRHVLVTGASSGLGAFFARVLAARGARVTLAARRREVLDKVVSSIFADGGLAS